MSTISSRPFPVLQDGLDTASPEAAQAAAVSSAAAAELSRLQQVCLAGGGEKGVERHVKINKKILARERIQRLLDPGERLWELQMTAGLGLEYGDVPTAGTVAGVGKIHGVDVMITVGFRMLRMLIKLIMFTNIIMLTLTCLIIVLHNFCLLDVIEF